MSLFENKRKRSWTEETQATPEKDSFLELDLSPLPKRKRLMPIDKEGIDGSSMPTTSHPSSSSSIARLMDDTPSPPTTPAFGIAWTSEDLKPAPHSSPLTPCPIRGTRSNSTPFLTRTQHLQSSQYPSSLQDGHIAPLTHPFLLSDQTTFASNLFGYQLPPRRSRSDVHLPSAKVSNSPQPNPFVVAHSYWTSTPSNRELRRSSSYEDSSEGNILAVCDWRDCSDSDGDSDDTLAEDDEQTAWSSDIDLENISGFNNDDDIAHFGVHGSEAQIRLYGPTIPMTPHSSPLLNGISSLSVSSPISADSSPIRPARYKLKRRRSEAGLDDIGIDFQLDLGCASDPASPSSDISTALTTPPSLTPGLRIRPAEAQSKPFEKWGFDDSAAPADPSFSIGSTDFDGLIIKSSHGQAQQALSPVVATVAPQDHLRLIQDDPMQAFRTPNIVMNPRDQERAARPRQPLHPLRAYRDRQCPY